MGRTLAEAEINPVQEGLIPDMLEACHTITIVDDQLDGEGPEQFSLSLVFSLENTNVAVVGCPAKVTILDRRMNDTPAVATGDYSTVAHTYADHFFTLWHVGSISGYYSHAGMCMKSFVEQSQENTSHYTENDLPYFTMYMVIVVSCTCQTIGIIDARVNMDTISLVTRLYGYHLIRKSVLYCNTILHAVMQR